MIPTNYIKLWIRAYRRRRIRKVLSKEFKTFFTSIYNAQIKGFKLKDYIISKLIPQSKLVNLSYIFIILLKIITLYVIFLILYDSLKFLFHVIFLFRKFIYKQKLLYWYMILIDFERLCYKFKKIPRVYIKDTIGKHTIIRDYLLFVNKYMKTYNSVSCLEKQNQEFYETRKLDWELFHEKAKRQFRDWRRTAFYYLIELNYIRYSNLWTFKYSVRLRRFKFKLMLPYRRIYYKYAKKVIRFLNSKIFFKIILRYSKIRSFFKAFFKKHVGFQTFLLNRFKKKYIYLYRKYGYMRYISFISDLKNKIENVDEYIVEKEIKTDSLVYGRVLNEKKYFDSLKGSGNIFLSARFYKYKISHKVYFDRNHYIMYLDQLELILKKRHYPEEDFNITFKLKFWKKIKPFILIFIRIYPYICKPIFKLKIVLNYIIFGIKAFWYILDKIYVEPILDFIMDKLERVSRKIYNWSVRLFVGFFIMIYTFSKKKFKEIRFIIWTILKGK